MGRSICPCIDVDEELNLPEQHIAQPDDLHRQVESPVRHAHLEELIFPQQRKGRDQQDEVGREEERGWAGRGATARSRTRSARNPKRTIQLREFGNVGGEESRGAGREDELSGAGTGN